MSEMPDWDNLTDSIDGLFDAFKLDNIPDEDQPIAQRFYDFYLWLKAELPTNAMAYTALNRLAQAQQEAIAAVAQGKMKGREGA